MIVVAPIKSLDAALGEIVEFAKIPEDCRPYFRNLVCGTVKNVMRPRIKKPTPVSDDSVASKPATVMRKAHTLLEDLKTMEKGSPSDALGIAGLSLRAAAMDEKVTIKHFINQLELLVKVAKAATLDIARRSKRRAGRPSGTSGNLSFDSFVEQLLDDAQRMRGKLTIFKGRDGSYSGSLLKTIELLRAHLPDNFVPKAGLGQRLNRIVHGR